MSSSLPTPELRARFDAAGGKPAYVRSMFDRISGVYDLMNRVMTGGMDGRWRAFAARQVGLRAGERALDLGCGTGDMAIAIARNSPPDAHIVGVDFSAGMLEVGREKLARRGLSDQIELRQGDVLALDLPDGAFDAVSSAWLVRNLSDIPAGFREMRRVTRPGGRVVCLEMSHPYNPIFNWGYHLYFDQLVPLLGRLIGNSSEAYSYLPSSVVSHPDAPALKRIMEDAGWRDVRYYYLMGGVVAVHVATNPAATASER
ncbi:MAG TPA: class I SAM-dependent methyltransferase [Ktedonobacterales bacterium]|jgi:demethylmenaquinone methyltransferase/2-methoxy-6-polyprenyl-1,4-benzoquinol methylase|nr:class I SAM-dependent methyltransferase [Ktedonobacterales bacterium]